MPEKEYIERETLKILFAGACAECRDSCAEFDGIEADCNQCLLYGVIEAAKSVPDADVVARDCYNRILAENDIMREQLAKIGKKPGDSMDNVRLVVRGKWVVSRTDYGWNCVEFPTHCKCTECGREVPYQDKDNFCPNCGADMRETNDGI